MGIHVRLTIQPGGIDPERWEAAYEESLELLRRFPAPLVRIEVTEVGAHRRFRTTDDIVCDAGAESEHWQVCGDHGSGRRAESFRLFRHLSQYGGRRAAPGGPEVDVLWADEQNIRYVSGAGNEVFDAKTQGYPYHLALVGVGALFETRFPGRCYVHGDLDGDSVEQSRAWVNAVLDTDLQTPVCLDGPALIARLSPLYPNPEHRFQRFEALFLGGEHKSLRTLMNCVDPDTLQRHLVTRLGQYPSLSTYGAAQVVESYLTTVQSVDRVIDLVLATPAAQEDSGDALETLLQMLCRRFITIHPSEREPLTALARPAGRLATIEDTLADLAHTLLGKPTPIGFHMRAPELLERFVQRRPELRDRFRAIVETHEASARKALAEISAIGADVSASSATDPPREDVSSGKRAAPPAEDYLRRQIEGQRQGFAPGEAEKLAKILGAKVGTVLRTNPPALRTDDAGALRDLLVWGAEKNGIVLWRQAWDEVDREVDIEALKLLATLTAITNREIHFCELRDYVLEKKRLWPHLIAGAKEPEEPAAAARG